MAFRTLIKQDLITFLSQTDKEGALGALLGLLENIVAPADIDVIKEGIAKREKLMSTGIGLGIAVPHVRIEGIKEPYIVIGVSKSGISDYDSIDNQPVHITVMIIVEKGAHKKYISILSSVVSYLKQTETREKILNANTVDELFTLFKEVQV